VKTYLVLDHQHIECEHIAERIVFDGTGALWLYGQHPVGDEDLFSSLVAVYADGKWISCTVKVTQ